VVGRQAKMSIATRSEEENKTNGGRARKEGRSLVWVTSLPRGLAVVKEKRGDPKVPTPRVHKKSARKKTGSQGKQSEGEKKKGKKGMQHNKKGEKQGEKRENCENSNTQNKTAVKKLEETNGQGRPGGGAS